MFDIGPDKLLIILAVALLVVGPKRIPEIARSLGRSMRAVRDGLSGTPDGEDPSDRRPDGDADTAGASSADPDAPRT